MTDDINRDSAVILPSEPAEKFMFRNRFRLRGHSLGIDAERFELAPAEPHETVLLTAGTKNQEIRDCRYVILSGREYATFEAAVAAGRKWRQFLTSTFPRIGVSCDFGDDLDEKLQPYQATDFMKVMCKLSPSDLAYNDRIGLLVFDGHNEPKFTFGTAEGRALSPPGPNQSLVEAAQNRYRGDWTDELTLAYTLVHSAIEDSNPETRFILLVTAIEALIPYRQKEGAQSALLEALKPLVNGMTNFNDATRESVNKLLTSNQYNSVRQYGLKLAARLSGHYDGKTAAKYYDEAYGTRSALAHGNLRNVPKLSEQELGRQYSELLRFVLDILESWTENPTFGEGADDANLTDAGPAESLSQQA